ncbi:MAG TPA: PAS domain S-box protein, partial [Desulfomonilaceae bacterium]|nr:PAS domain S-box protein [Desulfomonilaceae bacterium]
MEKEASESVVMMTSNPEPKSGKRRFPQGIQAKLILILLTLLIPTLLIQVFIYHDRFQNRRAEELQANLEIARSLAKTFDAALQDVLHQELSIGLALASKDLSTDNQDKLLYASKEANPAIWHFFWDNPAGIVVAATGSQFVGMDISDREFYREIIAGKDWVVSDLLLSKTTQQPSFTISRGIRNEQGELLGIIVAAVLPKHLDAVLGIERVKDAAINIMDSKGMVVYRHPATEFTWEERNLLKNYPDLQTVLDSNELVMTYPSRITGKPRLSGFAPIRSIGWIASSSRDEETVMASTSSSLIWHAGLVFSITLIAFGVALFYSRRLATIIAQLRDNALALGRGESVFPVVKSSTAELNDFAKAFHTMTEDLQFRERERKRMQEALLLSEEKFSKAFALNPAAVVLVNLENATVIDANRAFLDVFGYTREETIGRSTYDLNIWPTPEDRTSRVKKTLEKGSVRNLEQLMVRKSGERFMTLVSAESLMLAGKPVILSTWLDIDDLKQTEAALRESERRERERAEELAALLDALPTPVIIAKDPECTHLIGNRAANELLRLPSGGEISLTAPLEQRPYHYKAVKEGRELRSDELPVRRAAKGENVQNFEYTLVFDDGITRELVAYGTPLRDGQGKPRGAVHSLVDVTERKRAEDRLRESEKALQDANERLEQRVRERTIDLQNIMKQLEQSRHELRKFASELVMSEERERKRVAGVLHDEVAQTLAAARMRLDLLQSILSDQKDKKTLQEVKNFLVQSIREVRALMNDLGNPLLFDLGLKSA